MELWIKSQDGLFCGVVKKVELNPYHQCICCEESDIILGKYATVERCKEIIAEISNKIKNAYYLQLNGNHKQEFTRIAIEQAIKDRNNGIIVGNMFELIQLETDYYEMPQE